MFIVRDANDLKDPFLCFCLIRKFLDGVEEDLNVPIVSPWAFSMWMYGKGYIDDETIESIADLAREGKLYLRNVMFDEYLFPNSFGEEGFANAKIYSIFAEYMSGLSEFRQKLYDSVYDRAMYFLDDEFYKNKDGISLAFIIDDDDMREDPKYLTCEITKSIDPYRLSLKDLYNLCRRMTIKEADVLSIIEDNEDDD